MTVVVLGSRDDRQVTAVTEELDDQGVDVTVWDADNWPGETPLSFAQRGGEQRLSVDGAVEPDEIAAVYYREVNFDPRRGELGERFEDSPHAVMNQIREYQGLFQSVLRSLEARGVPVVNPEHSMRIHRQKPYQLSRFDDAGIPIPETLTTNDPAEVLSFVEDVGEVVYKPVSGGGHARLVDGDSLDEERLERLANSPVQFQERLTGETLRLFVVDGTVVATGRILSDELDYRSGEHDVEQYDPAVPVTEAAVRATETLGLPFSGVDVIVEEDRFGVLEANPSPMFATFDEAAGTDVAGALARYLASFA